MIYHEDLGMKTAVVFLRGFVQDLAIKVVIIRREKADGSVIPPLDEMLGYIRDIDSGSTRQVILSDLASLKEKIAQIIKIYSDPISLGKPA